MAVKKGKDLGVAWECECGKWNFADAKVCWKCHTPKDQPMPRKKINSNSPTVAYHITERCNLPSIIQNGLKVNTSPTHEGEGIKGIFLTLCKPSAQDILGWIEMFDPLIIAVKLPKGFPLEIDIEGMKIYPEVRPAYTTKNIPPDYIQEVVELEREAINVNPVSIS